MRTDVRGDSFAEFVRTQTRSLFSTAFLLTGNRDRAEDLLQETLTALYPKWDRVEAADHPAAYVRKAITNRFLNSVRSAGREVVAWEVPDSWDGIDVSEQELHPAPSGNCSGNSGSDNGPRWCCITSTTRLTKRSQSASAVTGAPPAA